MADPLAIVVSISSVAAVGTEALAQLYLFIKSIRYSSNNIQNLTRELQDLCSVLNKLEKNFSTGVRHQELWLDLKEVLLSCKNLFLRLRGIVKAHKIERNDGWLLRQWKRGKWSLQEKEVTYLRSQLEAHKATLRITLLLSTHTETTSAKDTTDRIEEAVREVIDRLIQLGDGEDTVATYTSSFILQRYLSSANSVFSSPPSSPTNKRMQLKFKGMTEADDQQIKITDIIHQTPVKRKAGAGIFGPCEESLSEQFHEPQLLVKQAHKDYMQKRRNEHSKLGELRIEEFDCDITERPRPQRTKNEVGNETARVDAETKRLIKRPSTKETEERTDVRTPIPYKDSSSEKLCKLQFKLDQAHTQADKRKSEYEDAQPPSYADMDEKGAGGTEIELEPKMQAIIEHKRTKYEAMNQKRRTYTKFSKAYLCKEALDDKKIAYTEKSDYFLVHRVVNKTEQNYLWARTKEIRKNQDSAEKIPIVPDPSINCVNLQDINFTRVWKNHQCLCGDEIQTYKHKLPSSSDALFTDD